MRDSTPRAQIDGRAAEVYRTAAKIILQKGYDAMSLSDIADALGLTNDGIADTIRGKTELLFEIMKFGLAELEREVLEPARAIPDPEARIRFIITKHARLVTRGDGAINILVNEARALSAPQYRKITRMKRVYFDLIRDTLEELRDAGRLREINVTVAAFNIIASVNWLSRWYQPDGSLTAGEIGEQIVDITLNGLLRKARGGLRSV